MWSRSWTLHHRTLGLLSRVPHLDEVHGTVMVGRHCDHVESTLVERCPDIPFEMVSGRPATTTPGFFPGSR